MAPLKLTLYQLGRKVRAQLKAENAPCTLRSCSGLSFPRCSSPVVSQMEVLNEAYSASGFMFQVERVGAIPNDDWFFAAVRSAAEAQMESHSSRRWMHASSGGRQSR